MKKIIIALFLSLFFISPVSAEQKYPAGTLIKSATNPAVYYIGDDGKRHAFPNAKVYNSWYKDFSEVKIVTEFDLADVQLGKNVLYRSGSRLIKTPSVNEVYAVGPWGELRNIASEDVAIALYGPEWAKLVDDIDISFFFDYNIVGVIDIDGENSIYPRGSLIRNDGLTWVIDTRSGGEQIARPISGQAWIDNNFDGLLTYNYTGFVTDQYEVGMPVYATEARFTCPYCVRENFDNRTVFETNFINIGIGQFSLAGYIPENWNVTNTSDVNVHLDSSDGLAYATIDVFTKEDIGVNNLSELLERSGGDVSLYRDYDLVITDAVAMVSFQSSEEMIRDYILVREYESYFVEFEFGLSSEDTASLEKHWDEIELILDNITISEIIIEEVPLDNTEQEVVTE